MCLNYSCLAQTSTIRKEDVSSDLELKLNKSLAKERHECKADIDILKSVMKDQSNQIAYLFSMIAAIGNSTAQQTNGNRTSPENYQHTAVLERREIHRNSSLVLFFTLLIWMPAWSSWLRNEFQSWLLRHVARKYARTIILLILAVTKSIFKYIFNNQ